MKLNHIILAAVAVIVIGTVAYAQSVKDSTLVELSPGKGEARSGACMPKAAAATAIATDNATAVSTAELNPFSCFLFQCDDDSAMRPGTAATGQAAVSGTDLWLPTGAWVKLCTTAETRYFSFINKTADSDCRYLECF